MRGVVIKSTGSWYHVKTDEGEIIRSRIKGKFRLEGIRTTNPVAVGDWVEVDIKSDEESVITHIFNRKNYIIRKSTNLSKEAHIIAANVDQAVLVVTITHPRTSPVFIDRFLVTTEAYRIPAIILFNKIDLYNEDDSLYSEALISLYKKIGYRCMEVSAHTGYNLDKMRELMRDKVSVLSGISGVGKSSLINRIEPSLNLKIAAISNLHDAGKHTTTFAEMYPLSFGGAIIDTPGIRAFGLLRMEKTELSHYFPELFKLSSKCRFYNCTHIHEPGCAVIEGVERGEVSELRYFSYVDMFQEEVDKYRK